MTITRCSSPRHSSFDQSRASMTLFWRTSGWRRFNAALPSPPTNARLSTIGAAAPANAGAYPLVRIGEAIEWSLADRPCGQKSVGVAQPAGHWDGTQRFLRHSHSSTVPSARRPEGLYYVKPANLVRCHPAALEVVDSTPRQHLRHRDRIAPASSDAVL